MRKSILSKNTIVLLLLIVFLASPIYGICRVFTIGDSTVQDYNEGYSPRKGWGQMFPFFFDLSQIDVINKAVGGTSSKSFYNSFWAPIRNQLQAGDYVFIQFGINDRAADEARSAPYEVFKDYIRLYVSEARAKGAIPVLVSTVRRNAWTAEGLPYDAYHEHPVAMRELAVELSTPIVDLNQYCYDLFMEQGELYATRFLTMNLVSGEYPNYPTGAGDNVHYQQIGATDMAREVCNVIANGGYSELAPLVPFLKTQYPVTISVNDPSKDRTTIRTATYPEGIEVTLKTIPESGANFVDWLGNNGVISNRVLHTFTMGNKAMDIQARYETANVGDIIINNEEKILIAPVGSHYQWYFNNAEISGATSAIMNVTGNGTYAVDVMDANWNIIKTVTICVSIGDDGTIRRIFLVGDSTVTNYREDKFPMTGWGQVFANFFDGDITIFNHAIGGRSSRSFIEEGRWDAVKAELRPGDYVFVQFGHNDRDYSKAERYTPVPDYKVYITQYVTEARALGAIPVLVSPMVMNAWNGTVMRNVFTESGNDYRGAMAELANEYNVAFVDLNMKSWNYFKQFNYEYCSRFFFNRYLPGEYPNYPNGLNDGTHFQECGAIEMARLIVEGLKELDDPYTCPLTGYMKPQYAVDVSANIENPGSITPTLTYPAGCPVTLKVLPSSGNTFNNWTINGTNSATSTIYRFTMPGSGVGATAIFNGGTVSVPEISLTKPNNNAVFPEGANIEIIATASSSSGSISNVAFYADNILIGNDNTAPYSITWNSASLGEYPVYAIATDNLGINNSSAVKNITVSNGIDCAGDMNGSAYYDDCGVCVGGSTGLTECKGGGQAEDACGFDGTVDSNNPGFSGEGFVNFDNNIGSSMQFNIQCLKEGEHTFEIVYANGGTATRSMTLNIGTEIQTVEFTQTANWQTWEVMTITATFPGGVLQCELVALGADGGPNIDKFLFSDTDLLFGSCTTDCDGVFGGTATLDECGICSGGLTGIEPCVQDCNGDWGGTAAIDGCGVCSGGNTGIDPCLGSVQGEDYCAANGDLETTHAGHLGDGYLNLINELGSSANWYIVSTEAQTASITIRYANGSDAARGMNVVVNGSVQDAILGSSTGDWPIWSTETVSLQLNAGVNSIELVATDAGGGPNIDILIFNTENVTAGGCNADCNGVVGGTAYLDNCNTCVGGTTGLLACEQDCNGDWGGTASIDGCDVCAGGLTGAEPCVIETIQLNAGWNLVGCPIDGSTDLETALISVWDKVISVKDADGYYLIDQADFLNTLHTLEWGKGYLIKVSVDCELSW